MKIETRTTMVPDLRKVYIANDGTEFDRYIECVHYEIDVYRKQVEVSKDVIECKELLYCKPFKYSTENTYRWFKPLNENGIELLNKAFPAEQETNNLTNYDIGKWHCIKYDADKYEYCWNALSNIQIYMNKVLNLLDAIDNEENR